MTNTFELHGMLNEHPDQVAFWTNAFGADFEATRLTRDFVSETEAPPLTWRTRVTGAPVDRLRRMTGGDPRLTALLHLAIMSVVAARATGERQVTCLLSAPALADQVVPIRTDLRPLKTFRDLLGSVRSAYRELAANLDVPVAPVVTRSTPRPTDFVLVVDGSVDPALLEQLGSSVVVEVGQREAEVAVAAHCHGGGFGEETARRLAESYAICLRRCVREPQVAIRELCAASRTERDAIAAFNATDVAFPSGRVLHEFLEQRAASAPAQRALLAGSDVVSYAELDELANHVASSLRAREVGPGSVVGVCLPRSVQAVAAVYGVLKAGAAYLPIDPDFPRVHVEHLLSIGGVGWVLTSRGRTEDLPAPARPLPVDDALGFDAVADGDRQPPSPLDLCYVIFTSGSTGRPKGVMIEHRAIVNRLTWMQRRYPLGAGDVVLHKTPSTFDVSVWELFWWSLAGATACLLGPGDEREPRRIVEQVSSFGVSVVHFVPSMLHPFLRYVEAAGAVADLASLRRVFVSGEALTTETAELFDHVLGQRNGTELVNLYGPTEAAVDVSHHPRARAAGRRPVPIGRPIANLRLHVLGADGQPCPIGTPGELCIAGVGLARGYRNRPDLTAERFVPDPEGNGERLYRTGDLARWQADGEVEYLGRIDDQVKIRGMRIEPREIEYVIGEHPGVQDCAVAVHERVPGDAVLCAYYVGSKVDEQALRQVLEARLPGWMVPQFVIAVAAIPSTHNGKRDLRRLPPPAIMGTGHSSPPKDALERRLAEIWARTLGAPSLGVDDSFFALGGDSIKFISVLAASREAGISFTFEQLFSNPTISSLLASIGRSEAREPADGSEAYQPFALISGSDRALVPAGALDAYPLGTLQGGIFFESQRSGDPGLYHDIFTYRIRDRFDQECFAKAVEQLVERHEIMRSSFHLSGYGAPLQVVMPTAPSPLQVFDLRGLDDGEQARRLNEYAELERSSAYQLETGGLVRFHVHLLSDSEYQYTLSFHDAALDGWSVTTIHTDLFETYLAGRAGRTEADPSPRVPYGRYLALEQAAIRSPEQRQFWVTYLAGAEKTRLPRYATSDGATDERVAIHDVELPAGLSDRLRALAIDLTVPVKTVLLAAHVRLLAFLGGTDDVLTGYEHSGRPEVEGGEKMVGLFLNTVPLRVACRTSSWTDLIRRVYEAEANILPYRRYPMAEIKRALRSREVLFDAVFNFTHFHGLKRLARHRGFELVMAIINAQTEFPFRAEFSQHALTDDVLLSIHYHADQFSAEQIARIGSYYVRALEAMCAAPQEPPEAAVLMSADESALLEAGFSGPDRELPRGTFVELFDEAVRRHPDALAVQHGNERLSYAELDAVADRILSGLARQGIREGELVCLAMPRGLQWATAVLAVLRLGAVYCPLDPASPARRLRYMLERSGARAIVTGAGEARLGTNLGGSHQVIAYDDLLAAGAPPSAPRRAHSLSDPAYVIFTSGSTGQPKGATIVHLGLLNHLMAKIADLGLTASDRIAQTASASFDVSVWQLMAAWLVGGVTLIYDDSAVLDPDYLLGRIHADGVTVLEVVPSHLNAILASDAAGTASLAGLRYLISNGEPLPATSTRRWFERQRIPLVNAYGPTECSDDVTHHVMSGPIDGTRVPVGRPIQNTHIHVLDGRHHHRPIGVWGELYVSGLGVGAGYINDPDRTAASFLPNDVDQRSRLVYRTGDVGRWLPDGTLEVMGRVDHQVKVRGFRIELGEVENALTSVAGVDQAAVVATGADDLRRLAAFYVGAAEPSRPHFRTALADLLPQYMVPDHFVRMERLPLTANGKVDRLSLEAYDLHGDPPDRTGGEPADDLEHRLARLLATAVGREPREIGVDDNFFDVGGHSIAAMRAAASSSGLFSVRELLACPTVRLLAQRVRSERSGRSKLMIDLSQVGTALTAAGPTDATVICAPYAGGDAMAFVPVARCFRQVDPGIRLLGIQPPGRRSDAVDAEPMDFERLADRCVEEIRSSLQGPIAVLGHCAGAPLALRIAGKLERAEADVQHLFIVARVLHSQAPEAYAFNEAVHWNQDEIVDWLVRNTGMTAALELSNAEKANLARAFRHDAAEAYRVFFTQLGPMGAPRLRTPITVILADDDPLTAERSDPTGHWSRFSSDVRMVTTEHGGHYLNTARPEWLANVISGALRSAR